MSRKIEEAKRHLRKIRQSAARISSPFKGMTLDAAIKKMRKVREELWEEKIAIRPRHK